MAFPLLWHMYNKTGFSSIGIFAKYRKIVILLRLDFITALRNKSDLNWGWFYFKTIKCRYNCLITFVTLNKTLISHTSFPGKLGSLHPRDRRTSWQCPSIPTYSRHLHLHRHWYHHQTQSQSSHQTNVFSRSPEAISKQSSPGELFAVFGQDQLFVFNHREPSGSHWQSKVSEISKWGWVFECHGSVLWVEWWCQSMSNDAQ